MVVCVDVNYVFTTGPSDGLWLGLPWLGTLVPATGAATVPFVLAWAPDLPGLALCCRERSHRLPVLAELPRGSLLPS